MFSFFRKKSDPQAAPAPALQAPPAPPPEPRQGWVERLRGGLRKTGSSIAQVFTGTRIDEALYDELEAALLMADAGVDGDRPSARRPEAARAATPAPPTRRLCKALLADALADLLAPLERPLEIGAHGRP